MSFTELVTLEDHGSLVLVHPRTIDVRHWMKANADGQWWGNAMAVEPRYLQGFLTFLVDTIGDSDPDEELERDNYIEGG